MELEESAHEYAQKQLAEGKKPKDVIKTLIDIGYEAKEAKQAVKQAKKTTHRTIAAIGIILAIAVVVLIAYSNVAPPAQTTPASDTQPAQATDPTQDIINQAIIQQDASLCDELTEQRERCINNVQVFGKPASEDDERYFQAMAQSNGALCAQINDEDLRTRCEDHLL